METKYIDLFCGIGGFRLAMRNALNTRGVRELCVFSSDIDADAQTTYEANFGERPVGDICQVEAAQIPDHDILLAGFPCQPFSIIGARRGFEDTRGTLFFDIARIINEKRPSAFILENVKQLVSHDEGRTLNHIMETLAFLGYHVQYRVLNALKFGLPQKRERVFIVGFREPLSFSWPRGGTRMRPLEELLEQNVPAFYYASDKIKANRLNSRARVENHHTIWHENKGGHISAYPYSCALRAGASYNYLLVDGERRLTERELLRLQGFPDTYQIVTSYQAMRKLTGNTVAVPVVEAVADAVLDSLKNSEAATMQTNFLNHLNLNEPTAVVVTY